MRRREQPVDPRVDPNAHTDSHAHADTYPHANPDADR
jgi:hypothetical protein